MVEGAIRKPANGKFSLTTAGLLVISLDLYSWNVSKGAILSAGTARLVALHCIQHSLEGSGAYLGQEHVHTMPQGGSSLPYGFLGSLGVQSYPAQG